MKKILALALALALLPSQAFAVAGVWAPITGLPRSTTFTCTQAGVTCDAPTKVTEGTSLNGVGALTVSVCAAAAQTLSGAGALQAYGWSVSAGLWVRIPDLDLFTTTASVRCLGFQSLYVPVPYGRIAWVPLTVTASTNSLVIYINAASTGGANPPAPL